MENPRLFVAVALPDRIKERVADSMADVRQALPFRKWSHRDDYHITLQFLGPTEPSILPELERRLSGCAAQTAPFRLEIKGAGTFGKSAAPSVLWAGASGGDKELAQLQAAVQGATASLGFVVEDRPYRPHITVARRFDASAGSFNESGLHEWDVRLSNLVEAEWIVREIVLYRSHLGRSPMYEPIRSWTLGDL